MARGKVRVSFEILPTKVIVAPNSPRLRQKHKIAPIKIPLLASGNVTWKNAPKDEAPNVFAAISKR